MCRSAMIANVAEPGFGGTAHSGSLKGWRDLRPKTLQRTGTSRLAAAIRRGGTEVPFWDTRTFAGRAESLFATLDWAPVRAAGSDAVSGPVSARSGDRGTITSRQVP
jgi:hypothetical protein